MKGRCVMVWYGWVLVLLLPWAMALGIFFGACTCGSYPGRTVPPMGAVEASRGGLVLATLATLLILCVWAIAT